MLVQQILNGLVIGSVYVLIASGLTIIFGVMNIVNFAHGEFYMLGALFTIIAVNFIHLNFILAVVVAIAMVAAVGLLCERVIHLVSHLPLSDYLYTTSLITIGMSIFLANTANILMKPRPRMVEAHLPEQPVSLGIGTLPGTKLIVFGVAVVATVVFSLYMYRTRWGKATLATFEHREAAQAMGINIRAIDRITFSLGAVMAGLGGALIGSVYYFTPTMGLGVIAKAFAVTIIGGLGSFSGAIVAGLLLGIVESLVAGFVSSSMTNVVSFSIMVVVLLLMPRGIGPLLSRVRRRGALR
ncbi:MAG: branched-chain amino acid ABC transporter permease [Actinobacteria bacterium]|nr:branched-chain amino acid ABC transporter permease [Actinomycetota bacterium]